MYIISVLFSGIVGFLQVSASVQLLGVLYLANLPLSNNTGRYLCILSTEFDLCLWKSSFTVKLVLKFTTDV